MIHRLQREMNRLFSELSEFTTVEFPPINIWSGENEIIVKAELPGIDPEKIDISVTGDTFVIAGKREIPPLRDNETYHRQERFSGDFKRSFRLPFQVDTSRVEAKYEKGVLTVILPRTEAEKPKKIAVKTE